MKYFAPDFKGGMAFFAPAEIAIPDHESKVAKTVALTVLACDQQGNSMKGATVFAILDKPDIDAIHGVVAPEQIYATANQDGIAVLQVWPNALGSEDSSYIVVVENPDTGDQLAFKAKVPDQACELHKVGVLIVDA